MPRNQARKIFTLEDQLALVGCDGNAEDLRSKLGDKYSDDEVNKEYQKLRQRHRRAYGVSPASTSAMLKFVQKTYDNKEKDTQKTGRIHLAAHRRKDRSPNRRSTSASTRQQRWSRATTRKSSSPPPSPEPERQRGGHKSSRNKARRVETSPTPTVLFSKPSMGIPPINISSKQLFDQLEYAIQRTAARYGVYFIRPPGYTRTTLNELVALSRRLKSAGHPAPPGMDRIASSNGAQRENVKKFLLEGLGISPLVDPELVDNVNQLHADLYPLLASIDPKYQIAFPQDEITGDVTGASSAAVSSETRNNDDEEQQSEESSSNSAISEVM